MSAYERIAVVEDFSKAESAFSPGNYAYYKQNGLNQYAHFAELLEASKISLADSGVAIAWAGQVGGTEFTATTPVGEIFAKRLAYLDGGYLAAAVLFYVKQEGTGVPIDLCAVRFTPDGGWLLPGDKLANDSYGRISASSVVVTLMVVMAAKLKLDHQRIVGK